MSREVLNLGQIAICLTLIHVDLDTQQVLFKQVEVFSQGYFIFVIFWSFVLLFFIFFILFALALFFVLRQRQEKVDMIFEPLVFTFELYNHCGHIEQVKYLPLEDALLIHALFQLCFVRENPALFLFELINK